MKNFLNGFVYAVNGMFAAIKEQRNLKVQLAITAFVVTLGLYFNITSQEWCIILLSVGLVLGLEMMNSAVEDLVNLVTRERKPLAGKIKDIAAGAVLTAAIMSALVGIVIFWKYF